MKRNKRQDLTISIVIAMFILATLLLSGCASFETNTYRTLSSAAIAYEQGMTSVADLDQQGLLTANQKQNIMEAALKYHAAYHAATNTFYAYKLGTADEAQVEEKILVLSQVMADFLANITPIITGGN